MKMDTCGYVMPVHPTQDWCRLQIMINHYVDDPQFPAFPLTPRYHGDRLTQYGFDCGRPAPDQPGVYAVVASVIGINEHGFYGIGSEHLLYIGCAKSIVKRLSDPTHHYWRCNARLMWVATRHFVTEDYRNVERSLIQTLRPLLNIVYNG